MYTRFARIHMWHYMVHCMVHCMDNYVIHIMIYSLVISALCDSYYEFIILYLHLHHYMLSTHLLFIPLFFIP